MYGLKAFEQGRTRTKVKLLYPHNGDFGPFYQDEVFYI